MDVEEDTINWFHTEISDVVLGAWKRFPEILQTSPEKSLAEKAERDD